MDAENEKLLAKTKRNRVEETQLENNRAKVSDMARIDAEMVAKYGQKSENGAE